MLAVSIVITAVCWLIDLVIFALFLYSILSWFPISPENPIIVLLQTIIEPVVLPFRKLMRRFEFAADIPIDIPAMLAFFALIIIRGFLSML